MEQRKRCAWCNEKNARYVAYHDEEWGRPQHDDGHLFALLVLESFQAGLSWECVLNKRENFCRAFDGFDPVRVAAYDGAKIAALMADAGIIRNRRKITASIGNARVFLAIVAEYGSFDRYIWSFTEGRVIFEPYTERTTSPLSDRVSQDLIRRGMRFVGSTVVYSYLQAIGVIRGHARECFLFDVFAETQGKK